MSVLSDSLCGLCQVLNMIDITVLARRRFGGRGIGSLLTGLYNGDPTSWSILGGVVLVGGIWAYVKSQSDD